MEKKGKKENRKSDWWRKGREDKTRHSWAELVASVTTEVKSKSEDRSLGLTEQPAGLGRCLGLKRCKLNEPSPGADVQIMLDRSANGLVLRSAEITRYVSSPESTGQGLYEFFATAQNVE